MASSIDPAVARATGDQSSHEAGPDHAGQVAFEEAYAEAEGPSSGQAELPTGTKPGLGARLRSMLPTQANAARATGSEPRMINLAMHVGGTGFRPEDTFFKGGNLAHALARSPDMDGDGARRIAHAALSKGTTLDLNAGDRNGESPLATAVRKRSPEVASALMEMGAQPATPDPKGKTPLSLAKTDLDDAELGMRFSNRPLNAASARPGDATTTEYLRAKDMVRRLDNPQGESPLRPALRQDAAGSQPLKRVRFAED